METGDVIKELRKKHKMTQRELAEALSVNLSTIQKYENGSVQNLKLETLQKLCVIFEAPPYAFVFPDAWESSYAQMDSGAFFQKYMSAFSNLTEEGREKALSYVFDLNEIPRYRKSDSSGKEPLNPVFRCIQKEREK